MNELISYSSITHAHLKSVMHPRLHAEINGRTAVKYLRFIRPISVDRLELPTCVYGRFTPNVPTHPAHIIVSLLDSKTNTWKIIKEVDLKPDPRIWGEGLSQDMSEVEMESHFRRVLEDQVIRTVDIGCIETDLLRVECDREYPVWPCHGEMNGNSFQVPYGILNPLKVYGKPCTSQMPQPQYLPVLNRGRIQPSAPIGMTCRQRGETVMFEGKYLSVGFALRRPIIMHLGWDVLGMGQSERNRVSTRNPLFGSSNRGVSGPLVVTPWGDYGSHHWTGQIEIVGNMVSYRGLRSVPGITIDATFHVEPKRLIIELVQRAEDDIPVLEAEAWRLVWNLRRGMTSITAMPTLHSGRSGDIELPAMFASDGVGCLSCRILEGDKDLIHLQAEGYRPTNEVSAGFVLGYRPKENACMMVPAKEIRATFELIVDNLQPIDRHGEVEPGLGVRRHWASAFSCYRPELAGFSNTAVGVNCHVNQHGQIEIAAFTAKKETGFDPLNTARFTIARALMDGSGYGYCRNLYLDSDPILISAAGRIFQAQPDMKWLRSVEPGLVESVDRMLGTIGENGLAICRDLSGNSGSHRWSSNACDVVGFGHMDGYVNAWTYRAMRNAVALLSQLGRKDIAIRVGDAAANLKANYAKYLVNPETGWVMGWRSRDGQVHDYAYLWINGPACAFGVLEPDVTRKALQNLETLREKLGLISARLGLPINLLPLKPDDHMLPWIPYWKYFWTEPTFEMYTDGSMSPGAITYYLRALSSYGFKDRAKAIAEDLDTSFAEGLFTGGTGSEGYFGDGNEFLSWEGLTCGYEGTLGPNMGALYAIAIEQGIFDPPDPEWWPEGG